jgi:hypothetical protein
LKSAEEDQSLLLFPDHLPKSNKADSLGFKERTMTPRLILFSKGLVLRTACHAIKLQSSHCSNRATWNVCGVTSQVGCIAALFLIVENKKLQK